MKFTCQSADFSDALNKVTKALPTRAQTPILEGIKIHAEGSSVCLSATDNHFTIQKLMNATVMSEGELVVPGKLLAELVRKLSDDQIELELCVGDILAIRYMDGESKINCMPVEEYPMIRDFDSDRYIAVQESVLKEMINAIIFSAPPENNEARQFIKGCLMELEGEMLKMVSLDGFRLSMVMKEVEKCNGDFKAIVPSRNFSEISKLLEGEERLIHVYLSDKKMMVDLGHTKITTVLIEGNYFDYRKIIKNEESTVITVNKRQLELSLERAFVMSRIEKNYQVKLEVKENVLSVLSNCQNGNINEKIAISLKGKDLTIAFNSKFIGDALKVIEDEFIKISFSGSTAPCIIEPVEGENYLYLIIPIRIVSN